jgi:hypothetical protein
MKQTDFIRRLQRKRFAYRRMFLADDNTPNADARVVIADLKRFCRAEAPCIQYDKAGKLDPVASAYLEGRREVYLRIMHFLHIDDSTIYNITENDI